MRGRLIVGGIAGALLGALCGARGAQAYCRAGVESVAEGPCAEDPDVPRLRWWRGCTSYAFHPSVFEHLTLLGEAEVRADFEGAFAAWRSVDCKREPLRVLQSQRPARAGHAEFEWDVVNESVVAAHAAEDWVALEYDPNALALTLLFFDPDTGEIFDVDLELNGAIGFTHCEDTCGGDEIDLPNVLAHEAGHLFGLGHSEVATATMAPYASGAETHKRDLDLDDRRGFCALDLPEPAHEDVAPCRPPVFAGTHAAPPATSRGSSGCAVARPWTGRGSGSESPWLALLAGASVAFRCRKSLVRA